MPNDAKDEEMPLFTVNAGGPDVEPGAYPVILTAIDGPKTITPQNGPNAGQEVQIFDWTFALDLNGAEGDGTEVRGTTSAASGPRSKMYAWLTALLGGTPPAIGATFEAKDLVGRSAVATIERSDSGWPRIANLSAVPRTRAAAPVAARAPTARERVLAPASESGVPF